MHLPRQQRLSLVAAANLLPASISLNLLEARAGNRTCKGNLAIRCQPIFSRSAANLRTNIMDFRGFDSNIILILRRLGVFPFSCALSLSIACGASDSPGKYAVGSSLRRNSTQHTVRRPRIRARSSQTNLRILGREIPAAFPRKCRPLRPAGPRRPATSSHGCLREA